MKAEKTTSVVQLRAVLLISKMAPFEMALKEDQVVLARAGFESWLRTHGKMRRPEMSKKQELELRECFELIDSEGSGVISTHEVPLAFTVLGMDVAREEIAAAVAEVNANKRTMEYPQFMRLMLAKLDKLPKDEYAPSNSAKDATCEYTIPFAFLALAYRRKKLIEAVMVGDKPLQDRMIYRSNKAFRERRALRDLTAGKPITEPKGSTTIAPPQREKNRAKAALLKKHPNPGPEQPEPALPAYLLENLGPDMKELLLGEKRKEIIKAAVQSEVKFMPPTDESIKIDEPLSAFKGKKLSKAYLQMKLESFQTDIRHKPTMKKQVIHVQALQTLRDFCNKGSMQAKGSPFTQPHVAPPSDSQVSDCTEFQGTLA